MCTHESKLPIPSTPCRAEEQRDQKWQRQPTPDSSHHHRRESPEQASRFIALPALAVIMPARKTRSKAADTAGTTGTEADAVPALQQTSGSASNGGSGSGNSNGNGNGRGSGSSSSATALTALFPLCHPLPDPMINTELISPSDISLEQDLLLNGTNVRTWNGYLNHVLTSNRPSEKQPFFTDADPQLSSAQVALLGPLASHSNRLGLRRVTLAYERALATFPQSYPLWKDYLLHRMHYVLGQPAGGLDAFWKRQISSGKTKLDIGPTLVDGNEGEDNAHQAWDWGREDGFAGPLDGNVGHREWESLAALFERALMHLPKVRSGCSATSRTYKLMLLLLGLSLLDASHMAPLHYHAHAPSMPADALIYPYAKNIRQSLANASTFTAPADMEELSAMGRALWKRDMSSGMETIPPCRPQPDGKICLDP